MNNKKEIGLLMSIANEKIRQSAMILDRDECLINSSYDGQVAALGVSIATIGLIPTLAIYYQDKADDNKENNKPNRRTVLNVITSMLDQYYGYQFGGNSKELLSFAITNAQNETQLKELKTRVINCSLALKQIVRTYNLKKNE